MRALLTLSAPLRDAGAWLAVGWAGSVDGRLSHAEGALVTVTGFAFYWVVLSVGTAIRAFSGGPRPLAQPLHGLSVAILLPMYGEPAAPTIGNCGRLLAALSGRGRHRFALHVLSDTRDPAKALTEEAVVSRLAPGASGVWPSPIAAAPEHRLQVRQYPRLGDETHGMAHDAMLILDADSVMGADRPADGRRAGAGTRAGPDPDRSRASCPGRRSGRACKASPPRFTASTWGAALRFGPG
jgi:membrane glycosyltransferase